MGELSTMDWIRARLRCAQEGRAVHVTCGGECVPTTPVAATYKCHGCEAVVGHDMVAEYGPLPGDMAFVLARLAKLQAVAEAAWDARDDYYELTPAAEALELALAALREEGGGA